MSHWGLPKLKLYGFSYLAGCSVLFSFEEALLYFTKENGTKRHFKIGIDWWQVASTHYKSFLPKTFHQQRADEEIHM